MQKKKKVKIRCLLFDSDTVACRILHAVLAQVDPVEHCPHVGPTGGGKVCSSCIVSRY